MLAHVGLAAGDRNDAVGCDRIPYAGIETAGCGEGFVRAEQAGNGGIAERETRGRGADKERAPAQIGRLAEDIVLGDFDMRIHVALRSLPALEAVRISEAARMIAFWMRE